MDDREDLQKVDLIRERMRCGYEDAKRALDAANGSVTEALAQVEREQRSANQDLFTLVGELMQELDNIAHEGAVRKVRVKFRDRVIRELPIFATAGAAVMLTLGALLVSQTSVEVEHEKQSAANEDLGPPQPEEREEAEERAE